MEENIVMPLAASEKFSDCEICHAIWSALTSSPSKETNRAINLGSFKEALSSKCSRHKPIVKWFQGWCSVRHQASEHGSKDVGISIIRPGVLELTESIKGLGAYAELLLVRKESVKNHPGIARILDPTWVDTSIVDQWRKRCLSSHGTRCENPLKIWSVRPSWVIDTQDRCLIPGRECNSFVALSYRWGNAEGLKIQADTMAKLRRRGALDDPVTCSQFAPIVGHAMTLTSLIGERYLWVDNLCIDHSRAAESTEQLQLMGAIYANASLTIVAYDGDAEDGFPGIRNASASRNLEDDSIQFGEERFIHDKHGRDDFSFWGLYHKRGWTHQEFNMSSKRLIFSQRSLHWMCQCSVWEEQLHQGVESEKCIDSMGEIMSGMPNLQSLSQLLGDYNTRELKYDEDALPGIFGLLTVFSRCFSGGFLCGIPEMFFEAALSWQPQWEHSNLRRRVPSDRPDSSRLRPCSLPSWSWVGWEGLVDIGSHEAGPANPLAYWMKETIPITTWYTFGSLTTMKKRRIKSSWLENRKAYKDIERPLPSGWTRHAVPEVAKPGYGEGRDGHVLLHPDGCGKYTFRHSTISEDNDRQQWHWPFPVPDIQESTQPFMPEQTPYLCCDTRRARVFSFQTGRYNTATLYSGQDKEIGTLSLHNEEQRQCFPSLETGWAAAKNVELVAICRARYYSKTFDDHIGRYTSPFKKREVYKVLWVEWSDGVAYRLAIGEVDKASWEGLALEDIALVLG